MLKKSLLLFSAIAFAAGRLMAQTSPCGTDEMHWKIVQDHPEVAAYEAQMEKQIEEGLKHIDFSKYAKSAHKTTTGPYYDTNDHVIYDVPIVIHIVHDYGNEYLTDDSIFNAV